MGGCGSKADDPKNKTFHLQTLDDHEGGINCMAVSEDGSVLVTGSEDFSARLWATKTERCECIGILKGHTDYINCVIVEDNYVITGSADKTLIKWDMATCDCVTIFKGHTSLINRLICTGDFIFSTSYDRTTRCWDFDTGECIRVFSGHKRGVYPVIFIPSDEAEEELQPDTLDWDGNKDLVITGRYTQTGGEYSPNNFADFTARSWSFETGKCMKVFKEHAGAITCMATDPAGKVLFTGSTDQFILSWNILKGERLKKFEGHAGSIICLLVVNKIMYSGSSDHTGRSWVTEFGDCTRIYKGHKHTVSCLKFRNGMLYTGSGDASARVFDAKSGTVKRTFTGHDFSVNCIQVIDEKVYTGSHDSTLRVWDASEIKDDTAFGKDDDDKEKEKKVDKDNVKSKENGHTKILIDEDDQGKGLQNTNGSEIPKIPLKGKATSTDENRNKRKASENRRQERIEI